ncbi:LOW QUALITY PROTEIN: hypothetical protein Cgig2_015374 [Carnegiea gigantea]|uniref:xyloglucan:xyloglucosyl transferase n=1 Tax=Carnegiea gigantea TaxID=171969 RepID=A0A9Q1QDF6_9CARY|nr:LOW QUALITY PROTEIN: hypothetical protein Cgig2_015374 [Carnegiea gigantea]
MATEKAGLYLPLLAPFAWIYMIRSTQKFVKEPWDSLRALRSLSKGLKLLKEANSSRIPEFFSNLRTWFSRAGSVGFTYSFVLIASLFAAASAGNFYRDFDITWGDGRGKILNNGQILILSLDKASGSGFQSKNQYLFGRIDMQLKLVPGNSAGTVTACYLSSQGAAHDEIDFEFLGNVSGQPYTLHTNVFSQGKGGRERQFRLWFDPPADFRTYSILWNPQRIIFSVDGTAIREFKNFELISVPFPKNQAMRIYSSLCNADDWATQGGRVKTDWSKAPFTASYRNFNANACIWSNGKSSCSTSSASRNNAWLTKELDTTSQARMKWVQKNYMIYNCCTDTQRFPQGLPTEDLDINWGDGRGKILNNSQMLALSLDKAACSGFQYKNEFLFGRTSLSLETQLRLSQPNITLSHCNLIKPEKQISPKRGIFLLQFLIWLSSQGGTHDEIDFEFLGNAWAPYTLNVFSQQSSFCLIRPHMKPMRTQLIEPTSGRQKLTIVTICFQIFR